MKDFFMKTKTFSVYIIYFSIFYLLSFSAEAKKILILYSTGGHSTAAKAISQMIRSDDPTAEIISYDFKLQGTKFGYAFYDHGYDLLSRHASWINSFGMNLLWIKGELIDASNNSNFLIPTENLKNYIKSISPDIIINTHFISAAILAELRKQGEFLDIPIAWTHLDHVDNNYYRSLGHQLDMTFLPTDKMAQNWEKVIDKSKLAASGIPILPSMIQPVNKNLRHSILEKIGFDPENKTILLLGGSMGALSFQKIIENIMRKSFSGKLLQVIAVCGRNEILRSQLESWASKFPDTALKLYTTGFIPLDETRNLQTAADIIISKPGGLTSFELLSSQTPVIFTESIGSQETRNANFMKSENAALFLPNINDIGDAVGNLLSNSELNSNLIQNQNLIRISLFNFDKILEWIHNPLTHFSSEKSFLKHRLCQKILSKDFKK